MLKIKYQKLNIKNTNQKLKISVFKNFWFLICVFYFLFLVFGFKYNAYAQDKIVAIVNTDVVTQKDLNDFINFMRMQLSVKLKGQELETKIQSLKLDLLDRLIEDRLILQEAKRSGFKIDEDRIKSKIEEIKARYPSDVEFQRALEKQGLTQADIEQKAREQFLMYVFLETKIKSKIIIKPSEVTDFYESHPREFVIPEAREVWSLSTDKEPQAKEMANKIKGGKNFEEIAKDYSLNIDKMSVPKSGQLKKEIEEAIFKLNIGQTSGVIKVEDKFYIFKLDNIIPPRQQNLTEAQEAIYNFLFDKRMQEELFAWLSEVKKSSYIKIRQ